MSGEGPDTNRFRKLFLRILGVLLILAGLYVYLFHGHVDLREEAQCTHPGTLFAMVDPIQPNPLMQALAWCLGVAGTVCILASFSPRKRRRSVREFDGALHDDSSRQTSSAGRHHRAMLPPIVQVIRWLYVILFIGAGLLLLHVIGLLPPSGKPTSSLTIFPSGVSRLEMLVLATIFLVVGLVFLLQVLMATGVDRTRLVRIQATHPEVRKRTPHDALTRRNLDTKRIDLQVMYGLLFIIVGLVVFFRYGYVSARGHHGTLIGHKVPYPPVQAIGVVLVTIGLVLLLLLISGRRTRLSLRRERLREQGPPEPPVSDHDYVMETQSSWRPLLLGSGAVACLVFGLLVFMLYGFDSTATAALGRQNLLDPVVPHRTWQALAVLLMIIGTVCALRLAPRQTSWRRERSERRQAQAHQESRSDS